MTSPTSATAQTRTARPVESVEPDTGDQVEVPRSVARVLDLLEIVLSARTCNLTAAANASELTPTTALRYLRALQARGYVDRDESGVFSAGPSILRIAAALRGGTVLDRLAAIAQPHLEALAELSGESAYLAVSDGHIGTYIATAESARAIRHVGWVGQNVALAHSALGEALADSRVVAIRTGAIETDITAMSRSLPASDKLGIAISIVGPAHRFTANRLGQHRQAIVDTVDALARELAAHGEDFIS